MIRFTKIKLIAPVFGVVLILLGLDYYRSFYHTQITDTEEKFSIAVGENFKPISQHLKSAGLLKSPIYWQLHTRLMRQAHHLKSGHYIITTNDTLYSLLQKFIQHDVVLNKFTILEGWTSQQILQAMQQTPSLKIESIDPEEITHYLGLPKEQTLEGWIYPDTYLFSDATSNLKILAQAHEEMKKKLNKYWENIMEDSPLMTPYQVLTLASIVEKEATLNSEKKRIAGVFISRLKQGMRLQSDSTVIYGLGEKFDGNIRKKDLQTDTPYNTYTRQGLPPTPIAMPDESSLAATVQPEITGDLYFVAKGDNSHVFSKTYEEHHQAIIQYQLKR